MEVPCYTDSKIEEFSDRIQRLKQEYRAYLHKLRRLEPDVNPQSWSDRPYANRKRQAADATQVVGDEGDNSEEPVRKSSENSSKVQNFVPISTPVLHNMPRVLCKQYGFEKPPPVLWNANPETEDQPLDFHPSNNLAICDGRVAGLGREGAEHLSSNTNDQPSRFRPPGSLAPSDGVHRENTDDSEGVLPELNNQPLGFGQNRTAMIRDCTGSVGKDDGKHICEKQSQVHSCEPSKVSSRNTFDRTADKGVNRSQAISLSGEEKDRITSSHFYVSKESLERNLNEAETASSNSPVHLPLSVKPTVGMPVSGSCNEKNSSTVMSGDGDELNVVLVVKKVDSSSSFNVLNLDYSDSSDESL
ncbi:hypothetical protein V1264_023439 [Littorina saxatilis]|uniref:Uncharacterized protein n=2 Tax=Littorina saxatilis TaxID=31220 RepID=A0AAN9B771_9CAEN